LNGWDIEKPLDNFSFGIPGVALEFETLQQHHIYI
jgi:hypothetical protein